MIFTQEEAGLMTELLSKLQVQPLDPSASKYIELVQSCARKIAENTEGKEPKEE